MAYYDGVGVAKNHVAILKFPNETKFNYGKNLKEFLAFVIKLVHQKFTAA